MWRIAVRITVYSVRYPSGALRGGGGGGGRPCALYSIHAKLDLFEITKFTTRNLD